jgi:hypothetical protein
MTHMQLKMLGNRLLQNHVKGKLSKMGLEPLIPLNNITALYPEP